MPNTPESATIQSKQIEAINACQQAIKLLETTPESKKCEEISLTLNQAQSAVAVLAHCLIEHESRPPSSPNIEEKAPLPPEPLALDSKIEPLEEESTLAQETAPVLAPPAPPISRVQADKNPAPGSGTSLAQRLTESRLESIQNALSINDRVRFAAELTQGDVVQFKRLCQTIDEAENQSSALLSVQSTCKHITDWEDENEAPFQFLHLVRRVFA